MDLKAAFLPIHRASLYTARLEKRIEIEQSIVSFFPDELELSEMLDALAKAIQLRRGEDATEVLLYLTLTQEALKQLANEMQVDAVDELDALQAQIRRRK